MSCIRTRLYMVELFFRKTANFNLTWFFRGYSLVERRESELGVVRFPHKASTMCNEK